MKGALSSVPVFLAAFSLPVTVFKFKAQLTSTYINSVAPLLLQLASTASFIQTKASIVNSPSSNVVPVSLVWAVQVTLQSGLMLFVTGLVLWSVTVSISSWITSKQPFSVSCALISIAMSCSFLSFPSLVLGVLGHSRAPIPPAKASVGAPQAQSHTRILTRCMHIVNKVNAAPRTQRVPSGGKATKKLNRFISSQRLFGRLWTAETPSQAGYRPQVSGRAYPVRNTAHAEG